MSRVENIHEEVMMKTSRLLLAVAVCLLVVPSVAGAALLDFTVPSVNTGVISYLSDGDGKALTGSAISVTSVAGIGTPLNSGGPGQLLNSGLLFFTTAYSDTWNFGEGGSINIYSADYSGLLLSGVFKSVQILAFEDGAFKIAAASFLDFVDPDLAAYYGLAGGMDAPWTGNFNLAFLATAGLNQEFVSDAVLSGDVATKPVPEPGTMMLLGSGLVALARYGRRRIG